MSSLTGITELEDLTLFIQEKMQEFDSTVDTSTGSSFYNNVIAPLLTRLGPDPYNTPIRDFILGRLSVEFPDLVLQDGEPLDDYAVKIMQILLEAYRRQIQQVSNNQSLEDPSILNEREADALGANFFVRRRQGGLSVGVARLYYSAPQGAIVTPNNAVFDGSGRRFFPVENQAISADNMLFNVENNLYYFDIIVRAEEEGTEYNIPVNTLVGVEEVSSVVKVTNKATFEEGADKESTVDFIERVERSLTEKSLVTLRGITARMLDVFESIRLIQVVGYGDPEMNRDIIQGASETPSPYAFFLGSTGNFAVSGETDGGATTDGTDDFDDPTIPFLDDGVTTSMILRILEGADAGDYPIATVANGHLDVTGTFTATDTDLSYQIIDPTSPGLQIDLATPTAAIMTPEGLIKDTFIEVGVKIGDKVTYADVANGIVTQHEVTDVSTSAIQIEPEIDGDIVSKTFLVSNPVTAITISDIPGGILQPTTEAGTIEINSDEIHIGGAVDVYVRAGTPIERDTVLAGVLDGQPLHFGVDLESFGEREDEFIHITEKIEHAASRPSTDRFGNAVTDHLLVAYKYADLFPITSDNDDGVAVDGTGTFTDADGSFETDSVQPGMLLGIFTGPNGVADYEILEVVSETEILVAGTFTGDTGITYAISTKPSAIWHPTEEDVGRYVQILSGGPNGLLEIKEVIGEEYDVTGLFSVTNRFVRIKVDLTNQEDPLTPYVLGSNDGSVDVDLRLVEKVSIKDRVRDRDGSRVLYGSINTGADFESKGVSIGDSVVIETGDDAGIYSVRRILDWLNTKDTLVLDRDLTKTLIPTGSGDGSGLRYRIADELNVDLVTPQVVKIPLGTIFSGDDLSTVAGSTTVNVSGSTNFLLAGVEAGDTIEILEGGDAGTFGVLSVTGTAAVLDSAPLNTASSLTFKAYRAFSGVERPMVRVKGIELLDSNSQPTGITIPYGDNIDARALGVFSNRAEGVQQESFTGETQAGTGGLDIRLHDDSVDFLAEGVVPGFRLNVFNTDNVGFYTVTRVGVGDGLPTDNDIEVETPANGGTEFLELIDGVHYSVGLPSSGIARIFFQEPTTVEIQTGLSGGRINEEESGTPKEYHFSEVDGYSVLPAGETTERARDIRVVRSRPTATPGEYETILELTDPTGPGVYALELQTGDLLEVNEQIPFRRSDKKTFEDLGIFGNPAGLQTTTGSSRVVIPANSLIDFVAMNEVFPLAGQLLFIDEGPDEGEYVIEEVVDSKTLRLNTVMTSSTESVIHREVATLRDATLTPGASTTVLEDTTDSPGTQIGNFITIFESTRHDLNGTFEIKSIPAASQVEIDLDPNDIDDVDYVGGTIIPFGTGLFTWINTAGDENVFHQFRIYKTVPTQAAITEVATRREDIDIAGIGDVISTTEFRDTSKDFSALGVVAGDQLEVMTGPSAGVYPITTVGTTTVTIVNNAQHLFPTTTTDNAYRIWGGLHGSRTMVTVGKFESDDGLINSCDRPPFKIVRPGVFRVSSTAMESNFDGSFYYVDINVESLGSGDEYNLDRLDRMVVKSGLRADGYTYTVENNNLTFSPYEQVSLNFDRRFLPVGNSDSPENLTEVSGRNLKVVYSTSTTAKLVHDLMMSDQERPINANPLGRHFLPSYVFVQLLYRGGPSADVVGPIIEDYINSLGAEDELEVSDLEAFISRRDATSIEHPITIAVITHDIDRNLVVNRTENRLGGTLEVPYNGTGRTSAFFAILGEGLKVEKLT